MLDHPWLKKKNKKKTTTQATFVKVEVPVFQLVPCLLCFPWISLRRAWLHLPCTFPSGIYAQELLLTLSLPGWTTPALLTHHIPVCCPSVSFVTLSCTSSVCLGLSHFPGPINQILCWTSRTKLNSSMTPHNSQVWGELMGKESLREEAKSS